jgi:hypothetical protein
MSKHDWLCGRPYIDANYINNRYGTIKSFVMLILLVFTGTQYALNINKKYLMKDSMKKDNVKYNLKFPIFLNITTSEET